MTYNATIVCDSIGPSKVRLTTFELTYPRIVHSEFMTHRVFSRNASSSRAIPIETMIQRVIDDPFIPVYWGQNGKGMVASKEVTNPQTAIDEWLCARDLAVQQARKLVEQKVHKQIVNRLLEPFSWITVVCTATNYSNFFHLRCAPDAQPEINHIAKLMRLLYDANKPEVLNEGEWHLPYVSKEEKQNLTSYYEERTRTLLKISVARCARVSLWHQGEKRDIEEDTKRHDECVQNGHWSPLEHQAQCLESDLKYTYFGNFRGWYQYRKMFENEFVK